MVSGLNGFKGFGFKVSGLNGFMVGVSCGIFAEINFEKGYFFRLPIFIKTKCEANHETLKPFNPETF